jgi:hypothetical protein
VNPLKYAPVYRCCGVTAHTLDAVTTIEAQLRRELHKYAIEVRKVAYSLPNGVGEHRLLRLSEQMNTAAGLDHLESSA